VSRAQDALRAAILKTLADDVGDEITAVKASVVEALQEADIERMSVRLPDGTKVASMPLVGGEEGPRITDPVKFIAWVKQAHPSAIEETVRDGYKKQLMDAMRKAGRPVDPATGEMVPGVAFLPTTKYTRVDFTDGDISGRERIRRAWRDGVISLPEVLGAVALPAGGEPG
jgi:hypothetical protein